MDQFSDLPPFPSDVPTAPLSQLSLQKLLSGDTAESERLFEICQNLGFFYLELCGVSPGDELLRDVATLFNVGKELFDLPVEEKVSYDYTMKTDNMGYKSVGASYIDRQGTRDGNEMYNVSKDDILGIAETLPQPPILTHNRHVIESYIHNAHSIVTLVLNHLNDHLHLPPSTLTNLHKKTSLSGDQIRFIKCPAEPKDARQKKTAIGEHSDFGSVTVLFNRLGGLQILPPSGEWCYVKPLPGNAIINLGDALVKFTNGLLRSNIHRVVAPPGLQEAAVKYSLVYFSRPEFWVLLKRLEGSDVIPVTEGEEEGEVVTSREWVKRRSLGRRVAKGKPSDTVWEQTRGTELQSQRKMMVVA